LGSKVFNQKTEGPDRGVKPPLGVHIQKMVKKQSEFVTRIKKLEKEGYIIDGAVITFTTEEGRGTMMCGDLGVMFRCAEEIKLQKALLKVSREAYVEAETKKALGTDPGKSASYTN